MSERKSVEGVGDAMLAGVAKPRCQSRGASPQVIVIVSAILSICVVGCYQQRVGNVQHADAMGDVATDTSEPSVLVVASEHREFAFAAAKDVLRSMRFELNRIDGREGVITTQPKFSSGLATPWDVEQSSMREEVQDLFHKHSRVVRVVLMDDALGVRIEVSAALLRTQSPGQKIAPRAVALSTTTIDVTPSDGKSVQEIGITHVVGRDEELESRVVQGVRKALEQKH